MGLDLNKLTARANKGASPEGGDEKLKQEVTKLRGELAAALRMVESLNTELQSRVAQAVSESRTQESRSDISGANEQITQKLEAALKELEETRPFLPLILNILTSPNAKQNPGRAMRDVVSILEEFASEESVTSEAAAPARNIRPAEVTDETPPAPRSRSTQSPELPPENPESAQEFLNRAITPREGSTVSVSELHIRYRDWCRENEIQQASRDVLVTEIRKRGSVQKIGSSERLIGYALAE